jgi:transcriptional regulator with XRE-family HTH domain
MVQKRQIGDRLKRILAERNMSLYELHKEVKERTGGARGSSYSGLRHYVTGAVKNPRPNIVEAAAHALGVSPEWLLTGEGSPHPTAGHIEAELETAEQENRIYALPLSDAAVTAAAARELKEYRRKRKAGEDLDPPGVQKQRAEKGIFDSPLLVSVAARSVFRVAWGRLADGCRDRDLSPEKMNAIGRLLLDQIESPLRSWGYRSDSAASPRELEDYVIALLHALMIAMAHPAQGDPFERLAAGDVSN